MVDKSSGWEWINEWTSTALHVGWAVDKVGMGVLPRTIQCALSLVMILWPSGAPSLVTWHHEMRVHQGHVSSSAQLVWDVHMNRRGFQENLASVTAGTESERPRGCQPFLMHHLTCSPVQRPNISFTIPESSYTTHHPWHWLTLQVEVSSRQSTRHANWSAASRVPAGAAPRVLHHLLPFLCLKDLG